MEQIQEYSGIGRMRSFRKAMEVEVNTSFLSKFSSKYRILAGVDIIAQNSIDFAVFKGCLAPFP